MKVSNTKKIAVAIIALVLAVALATGTTFAWFTTGNTVSVEGVDVNVTAQTEGLLISLDGQTFMSEIAAADLYEAVNGEGGSTDKFDNLALKDVALETANASAGLQYKGNGGLATKNVDYLEFTLYFRSTVAYDVYLGSDAAVTATDTAPESVKAIVSGEAGVYGPDAIVAGQTDITARAANAALVDLGGQIWNHNKSEGFSAGTANLAVDTYNAIYGATDVTHPNYIQVPAGYKAVADGTVVPATAEGSTADATSLLTLVQGANGLYEGSLTVRVWIDGWDADCFNVILEDAFSVTLSFVGQEATA